MKWPLEQKYAEHTESENKAGDKSEDELTKDEGCNEDRIYNTEKGDSGSIYEDGGAGSLSESELAGSLPAGSSLAQFRSGTLGSADAGPLDDVFFGYDANDLSAEARERLSSNAEWLLANPGSRVEIEGHCDSRGTIEYNLALGARRASACASARSACREPLKLLVLWPRYHNPRQVPPSSSSESESVPASRAS